MAKRKKARAASHGSWLIKSARAAAVSYVMGGGSLEDLLAAVKESGEKAERLLATFERTADDIHKKATGDA